MAKSSVCRSLTATKGEQTSVGHREGKERKRGVNASNPYLNPQHGLVFLIMTDFMVTEFSVKTKDRICPISGLTFTSAGRLSLNLSNLLSHPRSH